MLSREEAFVLIKKYLRDPENIKHSIAVEAILRDIAKRLERNEELWGLTGLLHNLDYEYNAENPENRGTLTAQLLDGLLPESGVNAIKANNYMHTDYIPTTSLDKALIATDTVTRLIFAITKSMPSKNLTDLNLMILVEKFRDQNFAQRYNRNRIKLCNDLGIKTEAFLKLSLFILKENSEKLN